MFQLKFKTILITAVIAILLLIGIPSSEAASITSLSASVPDDWGDGANVSAHLSTDEDIHFIDWHINNNYVMTSIHGAGVTFVNVDLGSFTGNSKAKTMPSGQSCNLWNSLMKKRTTLSACTNLSWMTVGVMV